MQALIITSNGILNSFMMSLKAAMHRRGDFEEVLSIPYDSYRGFLGKGSVGEDVRIALIGEGKGLMGLPASALARAIQRDFHIAVYTIASGDMAEEKIKTHAERIAYAAAGGNPERIPFTDPAPQNG